MSGITEVDAVAPQLLDHQRGLGVGGGGLGRVGGDGLHHRGHTGPAQVGQAGTSSRASLVRGPVAGDHPHLRVPAEQVRALSPQSTTAWRMAAWSGPVHHR